MQRVNRREFVAGAGSAGLGLAAGCGRLPWQAPVPVKVPRIGVLSFRAGNKPYTESLHAAFREALGDLGYMEGQNIVLDFRYGDAQPERMPGLAAELAK